MKFGNLDLLLAVVGCTLDCMSADAEMLVDERLLNIGLNAISD